MDADSIELSLDPNPFAESAESVEIVSTVGSDHSAVAVCFETDAVSDIATDDVGADGSVTLEEVDPSIFQTMFFDASADDVVGNLDAASDPSIDGVVLDESGDKVPTGRGGIAANFRTLDGDIESSENDGSEDVVDSDIEGSPGASNDGDIQTFGGAVCGAVEGDQTDVSLDDTSTDELETETVDSAGDEVDPDVIFQTMGSTADPVEESEDVAADEDDSDPSVIFQSTGAPSSAGPNAVDTRNYDVNGSGTVTALDALMIINSFSRQFRSSGSSAQSKTAAATDANSSLDVNKDTRVTPFDALLVINQISRARLAATQASATEATKSDAQGIAVGEPNEDAQGIAVGEPDGTTEEVPSDPLPDTHGCRIAGYTTLTLSGIGNAPVLLSVDEQGEIEAVSDGQTLTVKVDADDSVFVDGIATPVRVIRLGEATYLQPSSEGSDDITIQWPTAVDDVMAQWA